MRLRLLNRLDELENTCETCDRRKGVNNSVNYAVTCKGCPTYEEISQIGKQLLSIKKERKPMADKVVLDQDSYSVLKSQGKTDADISRQFGIKQATLIYYKKKWATNEIQPDTAKISHSECSCSKEDKSAEYEQLIKALRNDLKEAHNQCDEKDEKIRQLENVNAACEDVENETASLREEKNRLQWEYDKLKSKEYHTSYTVENQKKRINDLAKTLERYELENRAMRELLRQWI